METSPPDDISNPSLIRQLMLPIFCGIGGILLTLIIGNIPFTHTSLLLSAAFMAVLMAQALWLHKVIQSLREEIKKDDAIKLPLPQINQLVSEDEHSQNDVLIEVNFLQQSLDRLDIPHPLHVQAKGLQDNKPHLLLTKGLLPLLKDNQVEILVRPIVNLPQKRLTFFHCIPCVIIENGANINLNTLSGDSESLPSYQAIDRILLFRVLQFVRRQKAIHPNYGFVCHLSPAIYKDHQCLEELCNFLQQSHFPFQGLIFEVPLEITETTLNHLSRFVRQGVRLVGKWQDKPLPENIADLVVPKVDFITLPYSELSLWMKKRPHRQGLESLQKILEIPSQIIISNVSHEQDLYQNLPLPFDYASGSAFGLAKPFHQIQI